MEDAFPPGGPPLAPVSGNWKCFNLGVFALLPMHLGILVTGNSTMIWESPSSPTTSGLWEVRLKVSWCGEHLCYAAWQTYMLSKRWPAPPKEGKSRSTDCPGYPQKAALSTHWISTNWHFWTILTEVFFRAFSLISKANARIQHVKTGHGLHSTHVRRLYFPLLV